MSPRIHLEPFNRKRGKNQPFIHKKLQDAVFRGARQLFNEHPELQAVLDGPNTKAHLQNRLVYGDCKINIHRNNIGDIRETRMVPLFFTYNDHKGQPRKMEFGSVSWQDFGRVRMKSAVYAGTINIPENSLDHKVLAQVSKKILKKRGGSPAQRELPLSV